MNDREQARERSGLTAFVKATASILMAVLMFFGASYMETMLQNTFLIPSLIYTSTESGEYFYSSFPLKSGKIIVHPQLQIFYDGQAVKFLHLQDLYELKETDYVYGSEGNRFNALEAHWEEAGIIGGKIKQDILRQLDENSGNHLKFSRGMLLELRFTNCWRNAGRTEYYRMEEDAVYLITEEEARRWLNEQDISLDASEDMIEEIGTVCTERIRMISRQQ